MNKTIANTVQLSHAVDLTSNRRDKTNPLQIDSWAINTAQNSMMKYQMGSSPWLLRREKTVQLIAPNTIFREDCSQVTKPIHYVYCCFLAQEPFGLRHLIGPFGYALIEDPNHLVLSHLKHLAKTYNELGELGWYKNQAQLYDLLDLLNDLRATDEPGHWVFPSKQSPKFSSDFVKSVQNIMWLKRHEIIHLDDICHSLNISRSSLSHRYKQASGESPLETQTRWRITEAKKMLNEGIPIKVAAEHLGFCDIYYFSKAFKKYSGVSPREYRKQNQNQI